MTIDLSGFVNQDNEYREIGAVTADVMKDCRHPIRGEDLTRLVRETADTAHARYPQYAGHWDGPEWSLVRIKRNVTTKMGGAFLKGDYTLLREERDLLSPGHTSYMAYSLRNMCDTAILYGDFDYVAEVVVRPSRSKRQGVRGGKQA